MLFKDTCKSCCALPVDGLLRVGLLLLHLLQRHSGVLRQLLSGQIGPRQVRFADSLLSPQGRPELTALARADPPPTLGAGRFFYWPRGSPPLVFGTIHTLSTTTAVP